MCGRYTMGTEEENIRFKEIVEEANKSIKGNAAIAIRENGDVYPGDIAPVLATDSSKEYYRAMRWGFKTENRPVINARCETAAEKPMFRESMRSMRCLIPVMGYYEWNARKEKFLFMDPDGDLLMLAGLYRYSADGLPEFTIITREATGACGEIHGRMPLIIRDKDIWLREPLKAAALLRSGGSEKLDIICCSPQQLSMF